MKKIILFFVIVFAFMSVFGDIQYANSNFDRWLESSAVTKKFGAGIILGEPTALSGRLNFSKYDGFDLAVAWSLRNVSRFYIHSDYLRRFYVIKGISGGEMPFYLGFGGRVGFETYHDDSFYHSETRSLLVGARLPAGIMFQLTHFPMEFFLETAFIVDFLPETAIDLNLGLGLRFCF